jgi:hypothetical protein
VSTVKYTYPSLGGVKSRETLLERRSRVAARLLAFSRPVMPTAMMDSLTARSPHQRLRTRPPFIVSLTYVAGQLITGRRESNRRYRGGEHRAEL